MGFNAISKCEDVKYVTRVHSGSDIQDMNYFGINTAKVYDSMDIGLGSMNILFSADCWDSMSDILYSYECQSNCHHLFLCI